MVGQKLLLQNWLILWQKLEEVHLESLKCKSVWVKVSCRTPNQIGGTTEVFTTKQGRKISWFCTGEKISSHHKNDDIQLDEDAVTDEDEADSQDSLAWLDPPKSANQKEYGSSKQVGKQHQHDVDQSKKMMIHESDQLVENEVEQLACGKQGKEAIDGDSENSEVQLQRT